MKNVLKTCGWVLVGLFVIYTFYFLWKQSQPAPVVYELVVPEQRDIYKNTVATGTLEARTQVELKPQITGVITKLHVQPGQQIKAGDLVAVIRVIPDMGMLTQAQSSVEAARISLDEIQRETERTQRLYDKGVVSKEEYEQAQNRLDAAKDKLSAARAQVEVIQKGSSARAGNINTTEVRSTMNGIVLNVPVKEGTSVSGSSAYSDGTTIATVADMKNIIFHGNIDETEVGQLVNSMPMKITIGALQDLMFDAALEYISPKAVESNGANQFEIKAAVRLSEGGKIRSGYSANAEIVLSKADGVLTIPESAIEFSGDSTFVYIIKGEGKEKTYERTAVTTGLSDGVNIEIKKGLTAKDKVRGPEIITDDSKDE